MKESVGVCSALSNSVWGAGAALSVSEQMYLTLMSNGVASTQSVGVSQKGKSEHP